MDAVVTNAPTHHVHDIACNRCFDVRWAAIWKGTRHDANGSAIDEWFADVSVIKHDRSVDGRDARFITPYTYASMNASKHTRGVEEVLRKIALPIGGPKQNTSVLAIGRAPKPVPKMSRFTPTIPVMAPP